MGSLGSDGAGDQQSGEGEDADHFSGCGKSQVGSRWCSDIYMYVGKTVRHRLSIHRLAGLARGLPRYLLVRNRDILWYRA